MGRAQLLNAALAGRGEAVTEAIAATSAGKGLGLGRLRDRPFLVGGIATIPTGQDQILTGIGRHHEFLAGGATDRAAICLHRHSPQPAAAEDAAIGLIHGRIGLLQAGLIGMKGVGVLHDEFAPPHQAEARPDLITKFGLDLIEVHRQLPVRAQ